MMESIMYILLSLSIGVASVFATMYFSLRKTAGKTETERDSLSSRLEKLREENIQLLASSNGKGQPLNRENLLAYLRDEQGASPEFNEEDNHICFLFGNEKFHIDASRLPRQTIILKGYNVDEVMDMDWDAMEEAADIVAKELVMVKMHIHRGGMYDFMIVSTDRTIGNFALNFDFYLSLINDAQSLFLEKYQEIIQSKAERQGMQVGYINEMASSRDDNKLKS